MLSKRTGLEDFYECLEMLGEPEVRNRITQGTFSADERGVAEGWLAQNIQERQELRAEQTLALTKGANSRATWANVIACIAVAIGDCCGGRDCDVCRVELGRGSSLPAAAIRRGTPGTAGKPVV